MKPRMPRASNVPACVLNLAKPAGVTSRAVVDRVVRATGCRKVGHAGTLDPLATGVLVVCVAGATRLVPIVQQLPKVYRARFRLGATSPTDDVDGPVTELPDTPAITREQLLRSLPEFTGEIDQVPPAYSAVKVGGRRAYEQARRGKAITLEARRVTVYRLRLVAFNFPAFELEICCSGGTYVRSLGRDIAERLGTKAVMTALVRSAIGPFELSDAVDPDRLTPSDWASFAVPARMAVAHLTPVRCGGRSVRALRNGRPLDLKSVRILPSPSLPWAPPGWQPPGDVYAIVNERDELMAIARRKDGRLHPRIVLPEPSGTRPSCPRAQGQPAANPSPPDRGTAP